MEFVKKNKLVLFLLAVIFFLLVGKFKSQSLTFRNQESFGGATMDTAAPMMGKSMMPVSESYAPQPDVANRMVIQESSLSLQVRDVAQARDDIVAFAKENGGYMVAANTTTPEESPTGAVTIRVRADALDKTLAYLRGLAVKVVSENLTGYDVTDQFVDIDKRIEILETTKTRFESILKSAQEVSDIAQLNREIIQVQSEIDALRGQQEALSKNAELVKMTVYLATDEIALPYAPTEAWRPSVIFKFAVRSVVSDLRSIGTGIIWLAVYAVFWVPAIVILWLVFRYASRKNK